MRILVTGTEGYIGIRLADYLLQNGFDVTGLDSGYYSAGWLYHGISQRPHTIFKDIRNVTEDDVTGMDAIVHLAELSNDPLGHNNPEITYDINHNGTKRLADMAKKVGVKRFVYFSSCSVYGASDNIAYETSSTNPLTPYAISKIKNEEYLLKIASDSFIPTIMRNATVYGPSPRMRFDISVNNLTGLAYTTKKISMDSDGEPWRPFVHIMDVAHAVLCILKAETTIIKNEIFNIGDSHSNYQIKDIARIIGEAIPDASITLNEQGADKRNYRVNFDKITTQLPEFTCHNTVETGVKELLDIFNMISFTHTDFDDRRYTRLKQIEYLKQTGQVDEKLYLKN